MISKKNIEGLLDISKQTGVHINDLLSTYTRKELQYYYRDTHSYQMNNIDAIHGDRALRVMREYASRKLGFVNYGENWIE